MRTAELVLALAGGRRFTTREAAQFLGISRQAAEQKLLQLCLVPNLRLTKDGPVWYSLSA